MGDGGASWRARQLHRVREKAKRDGTNVEELAHEHFGSVSQMKREISEKRRNHRDRNRAATGGRGCSPAHRLPDPLRSPRAQCEGAFSSEYSHPLLYARRLPALSSWACLLDRSTCARRVDDKT